MSALFSAEASTSPLPNTRLLFCCTALEQREIYCHFALQEKVPVKSGYLVLKLSLLSNTAYLFSLV